MSLINLQYETQLLESLDWCHEKLSKFYTYLEENFNSEILIMPDTLLKNIERDFGVQTKIVCEGIFKHVVLTNNLHKGDNKIEH